MPETSWDRNTSLAAARSNSRLFSVDPLPFDITSKRDLASIKIYWLMCCFGNLPSYVESVKDASKRSEKAMTSAAIADLHRNFDLYDLKVKGTTLCDASVTLTFNPT